MKESEAHHTGNSEHNVCQSGGSSALKLKAFQTRPHGDENQALGHANLNHTHNVHESILPCGKPQSYQIIANRTDKMTHPYAQHILHCLVSLPLTFPCPLSPVPCPLCRPLTCASSLKSR